MGRPIHGPHLLGLRGWQNAEMNWYNQEGPRDGLVTLHRSLSMKTESKQKGPLFR